MSPTYKDSPDVFPPVCDADSIQGIEHHRQALQTGLARFRHSGSAATARHTYATMGLMASMSPLYNQQLGNNVQMLFSNTPADQVKLRLE
ncbi:hypothetical protein [Azorhizophilus paspali]|uniref:Uncharacterized protein n=1 Tax=Azorhizophilus paspali TaxID=69963 RepID=A0ABV6SRL2_AZOPA